MREARPTSVYVIECAGYTKIGVAVSPERRVKAVNTGSPLKAALVGAREFDSQQVAFEVESRLHRRFAKLRSNNEWFDVSARTAMQALRAVRPLKPSGIKARGDSLAAWEPRPDEEVIPALNALAGIR